MGPGTHIVNAVRVDESEAPIIDGDLSEPVWERAEVIDDFVQSAPDTGAPPTERTELRILYDSNNLYVAIYSFHSSPEDIVPGIMERDGQIWNADHVRINLDPGATRRNGYGFHVNAAGARRDLYLQNNTTQIVQWDAIWDAKTQVVSDGWIAEYAIPFRSLSYDPDRTEWGLEFFRTVRAKNENIRWSAYNPAITDRDLTMAGTLTGISNISQGHGLDLYVYGTGRIERDWQGSDTDTVTGTGGATVFYRVTPSLTATLTTNPDFSNSPLDDRQVNITRFSLFFPETRDFFLRDAGAFEFGGRNFDDNAGRPFVTRSIGLVNGQPVRIIAGGRLAGQLAGFDVGAVSAWTGDSPTSSGEILNVLRLARPVLDQSRIGFIVTNGDPTGANESTLAGADFQYRTTIPGGDVFQWDNYYERTFSSTEPEDDSFGTAVVLPNEPWSGRLQFKEVGEHFRPRLGFANRRGIRYYNALAERRTRSAQRYVREMALTADVDVFTDLRNKLETRELSASAFLEARSNDNVTIGLVNYSESIARPFNLPRNVPVPAGTYDWTNFSAQFQSSSARRMQLIAGIECCSFYNGSNLDLNFQLNVFGGRHFQAGTRYGVQFLEMPTGSVEIHVLSVNTSVIFTPDMSLAIETQWDNITEDFALSARYRWEYTPGNEVFIAFAQTGTIPGQHFIARSSVFSVRLGRTFQF